MDTGLFGKAEEPLGVDGESGSLGPALKLSRQGSTSGLPLLPE